VLLNWEANNGTLAAPVAPTAVSAANFAACTAPCMTVIPFSNGYLDYWSNPYYDYATDTIYAGDSAGYLHKFNPVFNGVPAEVTNGTWPILLDSGYSIASPAYDEGTGYVFVGDTYGYFYAITPAGAVTKKWWGIDPDAPNYGAGVFDAPLIDNVALAQYFPLTSFPYFAKGSDITVVYYNAIVEFFPANTCNPYPTGTSSCACPPCTYTGTIPFPGIYSYPAEEIPPNTASPSYFYSGGFDNAYFTSTNPMNPSGNLYAVGNTFGELAAEYFEDGYNGTTVFQIPIVNNAITNNNQGPWVGYNSDFYGNEGPLTTYYNTNSDTDYLFVSADSTYYNAETGYGVCKGTTAAHTKHCDTTYDADFGCVLSFNAANFATTQAPLGGLTTCSYVNDAPVGAMIIDNSSAMAGASQVYFSSTLGSAIEWPCSSYGYTPCDMQAPQAGP
ncbi:MAG: hypothetical protein ABSD20_20945, partial [Terriglobales bacterium]